MIITLTLLIISCSQKPVQEGITINGQFLNAAGKKLYFSELEVDGIKKLDSLNLTESGTFKFSYKPADAGYYLLKTSSGENVLLLMEKNDTVHVSADLKDPAFDYSVSGSAGSALLKDFYTKTFINLSKADSLANILRKLQGTPELYKQSVAFDTLFMKIIDDQRNYEKSFILRNDKSLASLIVLNYKFGVLPVLTEDKDFDLYVKLDSTLSKVYPSNKHVLFLHQRVIENTRERALQKLREEEKKKK